MAGSLRPRTWLGVSLLLAIGVLMVPTLAGAKVKDSSGLYVPPGNDGARAQIVALHKNRQKADAELIESLVETPQAVWFTKGTPDEVRRSVEATVRRAKRSIPVLVAYNIPFRDCAQFSAGGATTTADYLDWIDGFATGIGDARAIVILEPDGLGIIPHNVDLQGVHEWCQPSDASPATAVADRYEQLNAAVDRLEAQPNVSVYLDGTHSAWLGAGEIAYRLVQAGVLRTEGFLLNASNYRLTEHLVKYGTWISKCIYYANNDSEGGWRLGHYEWCASQYFPANPNDFSTWGLTDQWYADNVDNATPADHPVALPHFVIDTSRNGRGAWTPPAGYPDPQDWCNPPGRGTGLRPTLDTGIRLVDAYLWIKIPGESDGECTRGLGPVGTEDPEWGQVDPPAGHWFPDMALELARNAVP